MDPRGWGVGVLLQISNYRDDQMGAKIKTPKNPMPFFQAIKISRATTRPGYAGTIMNLQIVLNTQKNPHLNQASPKSTCQNFPTLTKLRNKKFQTLKNPSIIPVTWNPVCPPSPPGSWTQALTNTSYWPLWSRHLNLPGGHFFLVKGGLTL